MTATPTPSPTPVVTELVVHVEGDPRVGELADAAREIVDRLGGVDVVLATVGGIVLAIGVMFGVFLVGGTR